MRQVAPRSLRVAAAAGKKTRHQPRKIGSRTRLLVLKEIVAQTSSEDESQRHDGQYAKAQNGEPKRIVRGNLKHRSPSHLGNSYAFIRR